MLLGFLKQNGLSNRETEVAALVSKGLRNKEVANKLFVTEKTVKFHLTNIYKKLKINSRSKLILWCLPHMSFEEKLPAPKIEMGSVLIDMPVGSSKVGGN